MRRIKSFINSTKEFGFIFMLKKVIFWVLHAEEKYINLLIKYLKRNFWEHIQSLTVPENNICSCSSNTSHFIWSFWWQGYESMPEIIKVCYMSHKENIEAAGYNYVIITKDNYSEYIDFPEHIIRKLNCGVISLTHFSDLLRVSLLEKYGGAWIDITMFLSKKIDDSIFGYDFYSLKTKSDIHVPSGIGQMITQCKWAGFMMTSSHPHNYLFRYLKIVMYDYWKTYNIPIDYFFMNAFIRLAYENIPSVKEQIDAVPYNNNYVYDLQPLINLTFDNDTYNRIIDDTIYFKVTQKLPYTKMSSEKKTFYGYLYSKYFKE